MYLSHFITPKTVVTDNLMINIATPQYNPLGMIFL